MKIEFGNLLHKLEKIPFLTGLNAKFYLDHTDSIGLRAFKKDEVICEEGEYEEACCAILSGSVDVWVKNKNGLREKVASLSPGEIFGEIAVLSGKPRTATITSNGNSEILYINKKALFALMDCSGEAREFINCRYRDRVLKVELKKVKIFDGLPEKFFEEIKECVELVTFQMDEAVVSYGEESNDFYLIISGFAKVLVPHSDKRDDQASNSPQSQSQPERQKKYAGFKVVAYFPPGQYFGEIGLIEKRKRMATVSALTRLELMKIDQLQFNSILSRYCDVKNLFEKVISNRKRQVRKFSEDESESKLMDWVVSSNIIQTNAVLLIDLDKCIRCETCIGTCEKLFGTSRLNLNGFKFKNLLIPASCRHCHEPLCLVGCPTGAILRDFSGEVYHKSFCIGCGNCARNCPYGNISIVKRTEKRYKPQFNFISKLLSKSHANNNSRGISFEIIDKSNENGSKRPSTKVKDRDTSPKIATKCDNCRELPHMGCVQNCPRGAAQRVNPREYFKELILV